MRLRIPESIRCQVRYHSRGVRDAVQNRGRGVGRPRILFLRSAMHRMDYYRTFLSWLAETVPQLYAACEVRSLPLKLRDWTPYGVVMSWIGDSGLAPGRWERAAMQQLEWKLQSHGIARVNSMAATLGAAKLQGARTMARAGLRTPRVRWIEDARRFQHDPEDFPFPLLIRENYGHAGRTPSLLLRDRRELRAADLGAYRHPIAVEFVDVRDERGFCRRWRYIAAGDVGLSCNLHVSRHWEVRGMVRVTDAETCREERDFVSRPNPHHEQFQRARRELGLGFAGFDYSYDSHGELVVWEANTLPGPVVLKDPQRSYLTGTSHALYAAMARMLAVHARLPVPDRIMDVLTDAPASLPRSARAA